MKINRTKDWWIKRANEEAPVNVSAGVADNPRPLTGKNRKRREGGDGMVRREPLEQRIQALMGDDDAG